jgi:hypothetical protein
MTPFHYRLPEVERVLLEQCVQGALFKRPKPISKHQHRVVTDRLATDVAKGYLRHLLPTASIVDANELRVNQPGHDILVNDSHRIQVKGNSNFQDVQFAHRYPPGVDLAYDTVLVIDIGITLNGNNPSDPANHVPVKAYPDIYVVPNPIVRNWLEERRCLNKRGNWIHFYKTKSKASGQFPELKSYLWRSDILLDALRCPAKKRLLPGRNV